MSNVILRVKGVNYIGIWKDIVITRAVDMPSSTFSAEMSIPPSDDIKHLDIDVEDDFELLSDEDLLITGFINRIVSSYDESNHSIRIDGASKTQILVDSSATGDSQYSNQTIQQISDKLSGPANVQVKVDSTADVKIEKFQINKNKGETIYDAIERLADSQGVNISDTPEGLLHLYYPGKEESKNRIIVKPGINLSVKSSNYTYSNENEFKTITILAQDKTDDDNHGKKAAQIISQVTNDNVKNNKVKVIKADTALTKEKAIEKAMAEMHSSAGLNTELTYTIQGWYGSGDELWREGKSVLVTDVFHGLEDQTFIINSVDYIINDSVGTIVQLTLHKPDAYRKPKDDSDLVLDKDNKDSEESKGSGKLPAGFK